MPETPANPRPRVPLSHTIATRDSTMLKDAICYNCHPTKGSDGGSYAERRFGVQLSAHIGTGTSLGLFAFGAALLEIVGTTFFVNGVSKGTVNGTSRYQFVLINQGGTSVVIKNNSIAYVWDGTTLTPIANASTNVVTQVLLTNFGSGFTTNFAVTFTGGGGTGATATAIVSPPSVISAAVTAGGTGYTASFAVTFTGGGGTGATGVATSTGGIVQSISITNGGSGYTSAPTPVFTAGGGTGATGTSTLTGGKVTAVVINNPGSGYTSAPTAVFTAGGGTGAAAVVIILAGWIPAVTVPGVASIDGYVFVLDPQGRIWNSNQNTPLLGNPLNFISGSLQADPGVYITRLYNYVASMCQFSTTFFYDNGNTPPGSPLLPNFSAVINIGCASDNSVVTTENTMFWIGQTRQKGRSVYTMNALAPQRISDQYIDKILNADPLVSSTVYSFFIKIDGHAFYVLTLTASNCTLVYDASVGAWHRWSTTVIGASRLSTKASVNQVTGFVEVTLPSHGFVNGDILEISSSDSSLFYLGTVVPKIIDIDTFSYIPGVSAGTGGINSTTINTFAINADPNIASGMSSLGTLTVTIYHQNYFNPVMYANTGNSDFLLGQNDGNLYTMTENVGEDNGLFIFGLMRTQALDFGTNNEKFFASAEIIGDKIADVAYLSYSDDDFISFSSFRPINLDANRAQLVRCASARRRSWALMYIGGAICRFGELELQVTPGPQ